VVSDDDQIRRPRRAGGRWWCTADTVGLLDDADATRKTFLVTAARWSRATAHRRRRIERFSLTGALAGVNTGARRSS
jgi:hypothetical protein